MNAPPRLLALSAFALLASAGAALAHTGLGDAHDLAHGLLHPVAGIDHVLAMTGIGMLAARIGGRALWLVPSSFVAAMAASATLAMAGFAAPGVEIGIALSVAALGLLIAVRARPALALAVPLAALFAVFHGAAHGAELPPDASGILFGAGFVCATALLHLGGIGLGIMLDKGGARLALAGGGAIAAYGGLLAGGSIW